MQHSSLLLIAAFSLLAARLPAAEEVDPAMAVIKRMRDQLRTVMIQQQKTEAERATLQAANVELDDKKREELLQQVGALWNEKRVVIPLAAVASAWAMRRDRVTLRVGRSDEETYAWDVSPVSR